MKPQTFKLERSHAPSCWANRILRIDLTAMRVWAQETAPYVPAYLGARGIAARLCWDEYPEPVGPFDPANPLMVMTGALTGSRAPYSGRTTIHAFSPQADPYPWFTRSSIGGRFGGELKRAGYDGLVVTGASETPVRIRIHDDQVRIVPADRASEGGALWGLDTMDTLEALEAIEGKGVRSLVIGPAGERLSRIATIQTASSSAAGQGGFGAVMGAKNLKAISVTGTGRVRLADPDRMRALTRALARTLREAGRNTPFAFGDLDRLNQALAAKGDGRARLVPCTEGCLTPCSVYFEDMPGAVAQRKWSGSWFCVAANVFPGFTEIPPGLQAFFDWRLERRAAFEMNVLSNRYGLNQFDLLKGMVPWLLACQKAGLIAALDGVTAQRGQEMDWQSPAFWAAFLHAIAYREGLGDTLAEGGWAASRALGLGVEIAARRYPGWGQAGHWDGRDRMAYSYPYWIVSALQWMSDTRDPFDSGHGSLWVRHASAEVAAASDDAEREAALERLRAVAERVYGTPDVADPYSGYSGKAIIGHYHSLRPIVKDCVPVDDLRFPMIYRADAPDRLWHIRGAGPSIEGPAIESPSLEGPSVEYHLYRAGTGVDWSEAEFERAAERVCAMERALQVRHWGRDRRTDESVLPYFEQPEIFCSPFQDKRHGLDRRQFAPVVDALYALHGWDAERGWPTRETLAALDLDDVYDPMVEGAARADPGADRNREAR
jgi:aldehyde:ferredoxin oxidoreductase